jgi:small subunit ribosomal protein S4
MGDPRRIRKKVNTPGHPYVKTRIEEELKYLGKYGLRNKKEFWRHRTQLGDVRKLARHLRTLPADISAPQFEKLRGRLHRLGLVPADAGTDDILSLTVDDFLERRLQSMVAKVGLAKSIFQARQLITHGHIMVGSKKMTSPSYMVLRSEEQAIKYNPHSAFTREPKKIYADGPEMTYEDHQALEKAKMDAALKRRFAKMTRGKPRRGDRR